MVGIAVVAWLLWSTWQTHHYVYVWRSNLTLWAHAARQAPRKPRPLINYAVALVESGAVVPAARALMRAERLLEQPHLPAYDRADGVAAVDRNRVALARVGVR